MARADTTIHHDESLLRQRASRTLHVGFLVAVVLIAGGVVLSAIRQEPFPDTLGTPMDVLRGLRHGEAVSIIGLGVLAMILTPCVSAAVIGWSFLREGDRRYAIISGCVLGILLVSMLVASL